MADIPASKRPRQRMSEARRKRLADNARHRERYRKLVIEHLMWIGGLYVDLGIPARLIEIGLLRREDQNKAKAVAKALEGSVILIVGRRGDPALKENLQREIAKLEAALGLPPRTD